MQIKFLPHLQIWFHKRVNIHKRAAEGEKGIRAEKSTAHRDRHATVNLFFYIECIHFYDFSTELFKRNPTKADYSATNTPVAEKKKKKRHPLLSTEVYLSPSFLWSSFCLCCEPRKREVTFSINHSDRKLLLSGEGGGERTDTQLFDDWSKSCKVWIAYSKATPELIQPGAA